MENFSKEELMKIIEDRDRLLQDKEQIIEELRGEIRILIEEKEDMIENFKISTDILLEKIKELESQRIGYRPQTANILAKPSKSFGLVLIKETENKPPHNPRRPGRQVKENNSMHSEWENEIPEDKAEHEEEKIVDEKKKCHNCNKMIFASEMDSHTILCFRNVSTCKICGELIPAQAKSTHLTEWRQLDKILGFIESRDFKKLKLCFAHGADPNYKIPDKGGISYLHMAIEKADEELISNLLASKANYELQDDQGNTPLLFASQFGDFNIFKKLIDYGANIEAKNKICWTPLFYACKRGDKMMIEYLIENNVNLGYTTPLGDNCLKVAQKNNHQELSIILVNNGVSIRNTKPKLASISEVVK